MVRRAIAISSLGNFIDVFDIQIFAVLRVISLTAIGVSAERLPIVSGYILNAQMLGMILGGFLWGYLADRFGRLKALYGSILIYSIGTLLCSMTHNAVTYGACRFMSGFGLSGEVGAAVTLVLELMSARKRGWGVMIVGGFGLFGPVAAVLVSWFLPWRTTYVVAGVMGLLILILRKTLAEPEIFNKSQSQSNRKGSWALLKNRKSLFALLCCLLIGVPSIYGYNVMNFFSKELSQNALADGQHFEQKYALLIFYIGTVCGDVASGALTQFLGSRRKTIGLYVCWGFIVCSAFLILAPLIKLTITEFYIVYFLVGIGTGYWVLITTVAAEHFGTDIRVTAALMVTNFVRGMTIPLVFILQRLETTTNINNAAAIIALCVFPLALLALRGLKETHGSDLDYLESR